MEKYCMLKAKTKPVMKTNQKINSAEKVTVNMRVKKVKPNKIVIYKNKHTRTQIFKTIAENTNLTKTQIEEVFNQLNILIEGHLRKRGSGEITIPKTGIKLRRIKKKATKARVMFSPLTGQEVKLNAKPARLSVKLTALKFLKEVVDRQ